MYLFTHKRAARGEKKRGEDGKGKEEEYGGATASQKQQCPPKNKTKNKNNLQDAREDRDYVYEGSDGGHWNQRKEGALLPSLLLCCRFVVLFSFVHQKEINK